MLGIIMAGGKSTRMGREKLLLRINNMRIIDYVLNAVEHSDLDRYYIAVSKNAPKTRAYLWSKPVINTPGAGYCEDLSYLINTLHSPFLVLNGDSIFVTKTEINSILHAFKGKSMAGVVMVNRQIHYVGLNIVVPDIHEDILFYFKNTKLAININTYTDLQYVRTILHNNTEE